MNIYHIYVETRIHVHALLKCKWQPSNCVSICMGHFSPLNQPPPAMGINLMIYWLIGLCLTQGWGLIGPDFCITLIKYTDIGWRIAEWLQERFSPRTTIGSSMAGSPSALSCNLEWRRWWMSGQLLHPTQMTLFALTKRSRRSVAPIGGNADHNERKAWSDSDDGVQRNCNQTLIQWWPVDKERG